MVGAQGSERHGVWIVHISRQLFHLDLEVVVYKGLTKWTVRPSLVCIRRGIVTSRSEGFHEFVNDEYFIVNFIARVN